MTSTDRHLALPAADVFGRKVAARLDAGTADIPYDISERLRAARAQAVARRKRVQFAPVLATAPAGGPRLGDEGLTWGQRIASVLPIVVLAAGLVLIHYAQNDYRASELAEVDAALLTDDLPPAAYADPGFVQFLRTTRD